MNQVDSTLNLNALQFSVLLHRLVRGWSEQESEIALSCFTSDAVYMEPPDIQLFIGHDQLRPYFAALEPGTFMRFHNTWFDAKRQSGADEYSFGHISAPEADHGVAIIELRDGRIATWREYQRKGPSRFDMFIAREDKTWQWHIGNYP